MIDRNLAEHIKVSVLSCVHQLDESVKDAVEGGPDEHSSMYRRLVGQVMGQIFTAILTPIYDAYPDLEPEGLRRARQEAKSSSMSRETGNKLMSTSTSALNELNKLRAGLAQAQDGDAKMLETGLRETIDSLRIIQEFLLHVCPDLDAARQ
jgi:hypothetical protein